MIVIAEFIFYSLSINEVTSTIKNPQRKFNDNYRMSVICRTENDLKNITEKVIWSDYYLVRRGNK